MRSGIIACAASMIRWLSRRRNGVFEMMSAEQRDFAMVNSPTPGKPLRSRTQAGGSGDSFA
jgi:hypothetical protein